MNNTFAGSSMMKDKSNLAIPHSSESGTIKTIDAFKVQMNSAAGGIYSNVTDMAKWMTVCLNKGKYGTDLTKTLFSLKIKVKCGAYILSKRLIKIQDTILISTVMDWDGDYPMKR
jgi:CubicO group peptidase (beta-lactamase class C family)